MAEYSLAWWTADANAPATTAARVGQNIDLVQASGAQVVLATTPPISSANVPIINQDRGALIAAYNAALRQLADIRGYLRALREVRDAVIAAARAEVEPVAEPVKEA